MEPNLKTTDLEQIATEDSLRDVVASGEYCIPKISQKDGEVFLKLLDQGIVKVCILTPEQAETGPTVRVANRATREGNVFIDLYLHPNLKAHDLSQFPQDMLYPTMDKLAEGIVGCVDRYYQLIQLGAPIRLKELS